jgi:hypothetical protein
MKGNISSKNAENSWKWLWIFVLGHGLFLASFLIFQQAFSVKNNFKKKIQKKYIYIFKFYFLHQKSKSWKLLWIFFWSNVYLLQFSEFSIQHILQKYNSEKFCWQFDIFFNFSFSHQKCLSYKAENGYDFFVSFWRFIFSKFWCFNVRTPWWTYNKYYFYKELSSLIYCKSIFCL